MQKTWVIIIALCMVGGCSPFTTASPTLDLATTTPYSVISATYTPEPTHTATTTPAPSSTPNPTPSPTPSPTITSTHEPQMIKVENASQIKLLATYPVPARGLLKSAIWSPDAQGVLIVTSLGLSLQNATLDKQLKFFPNMSLIQELNDGRWLVEDAHGRQFLTVEGQLATISAVANDLLKEARIIISANGEVAAHMLNDQEFEVIILADGSRRVFNFQQAGIYAKYKRVVSISPDGKRLCAQYGDYSDTVLIDLDTLRVLGTYPHVYGAPVFAPDSQSFLIHDNGGYKVVKASNGFLNNRFAASFIDRPTPRTWVIHQAAATAYLPDSQGVGVVYCVQHDKCDLYIWSLATGYSEIPIRDLPAGIQNIDFSGDGKNLVTSSLAGVVQTWDLETASLLSESIPYDRSKPVISSDGKLVAFNRLNHIEILDLKTGELVHILGDYATTLSIRMNAFDGQHLFVAGALSYKDTFVDLWDLRTGEMLRKFKTLANLNTYSDDPFCLYARDGQRVACGSQPLQVFDTQLGTLLLSYKKSTGLLEWTISPDGKQLASCTSMYAPDYGASIPGDRIFLIDPAGGGENISAVLEGPQGKICAPMIFSPDNQFLAAQSGYIWKIGEQQPLSTFVVEQKMKLAFSPDGELLVANNQIIATRSGKILMQLELKGQILMVSFDPSGYQLLIHTDQDVSVWGVTQ